VANADGTFTFTPNANFSGSTSFNYTVGAAVAQTSLTSGNTSNDLFGGSVAISDNGDEAVVGAPNETVDGHANQGAAFLFMRSGTAWMEQTEFTASDGAANDFFGAAVAISGDTVVVGARWRSAAIRPSSGQFSTTSA
jgi:hypothetical protein